MLSRSNLTYPSSATPRLWDLWLGRRAPDLSVALGLLQILLKLNHLWDSTSSRSCHVLFCSEDFSFIGPLRTVWSYFLLARRSEDDCLRSWLPVLEEQHPRYTWVGHAGNIAAAARNTKSSAWKAKKKKSSLRASWQFAQTRVPVNSGLGLRIILHTYTSALPHRATRSLAPQIKPRWEQWDEYEGFAA